LVTAFERGSAFELCSVDFDFSSRGLPQKSRTAKERKTRQKGGLLSTNQPALEN
jgi:hypothetical protein